MSSATLTLHHFIQVVPICEQEADVEVVLTIFQSAQHEKIVVVNEQKSPLGVIHCQDLMPYVCQHLLTQLRKARNSDELEDTRQPALSLLKLEALIQPLVILPAQMAVNAFLPYLQDYQNANPAHNYALVDANGKCLGLLNQQKLFKALLSAPSRETATHTFEELLFQVLEQLPLPLMLQTDDGIVLRQNFSWHEQIGNLLPPDGASACPLTLKQMQSLDAQTQSLVLDKATDLGATVQSEFPKDSHYLAVQLSRSQLQELSPSLLKIPESNEKSLELSQPIMFTKSEEASSRSAFQSEETAGQTETELVPSRKLTAGWFRPPLHGESSAVLGSQSLAGVPKGARSWDLPKLSQCGLGGFPHEQLALSDSRPVVQTGVSPQVEQLANPKGGVSLTSSERSKPVSERVWQFFKFPLNLSKNWQPENKETKQESFQSSIWLVLATDVTEQQRLCKELVAKNADLVQLNRLKDEFLACISHELKSPLTAVVGLSSLLKEQKLGELNQRQAHYAELIYHSGRQLMTLVNDLLDLTRLETGQLKLLPVTVKIKTVCERAYASTLEKQRSKTESPLSFCLEIEPGLDLFVADELRLQQMLVHLLDNAIKFTQAGGKMGLKVNRWENWLAFTVWDTGIGIPEESQHLIFQKFQQLESPLTRQFEGTGLGLVLTQRLAQAHGGEVSFISKVGQGSQFTLLLPPSPISQRMQQTSVNPQPQHNPLVLMVEAIPQAIENLAEQLKNLGYYVVVARTGTEALEKARQLQPYIIFLNPLLPLLSGWDVLTLLKSDPRLRKIPTIITAMASERQQAEQNEADGFLSLPVEQEALKKLLNYHPSPQPQYLTILRLHPDADKSGWIGSMLNSQRSAGESSGVNRVEQAQANLSLDQLSQFNHRLLEADDLEQAEMIARVWQVDVVILEKTIFEPLTYLRSLLEYTALASLPLITLDAKTTEAANQVNGLSIFPCLVPANEQSLDKLLQVIQIAAGIDN